MSTAKRTYCSRVFSLHTFCRALRCSCRCSGPQPCTGDISSWDPPISRLRRLNWRCRCLPCLFHAPFHPSHRNHCLLCRRSQAILTSLSTCQKMIEASRICCGLCFKSPCDRKPAWDSDPETRASTRQQEKRKQNMRTECHYPHSFPRCLVKRANPPSQMTSTGSLSTPISKL